MVDPTTVSVIGANRDTGSVSSPPEKKTKKDKPSTSISKKPTEKSTESKSATAKKMEELDQKWLDRFNHLETLLMSETFQPTFSSAVKVTPSHSPPGNVPKDTEPFFQLTSSERTGTDFSAMHQLASQLGSDTSTSEHTGQGSSASQHHPSSQLRSDLNRPESSPKRTGTDSSASKHQSTSQLRSDRHRPVSSSPKHTGSDSSASKQQSTSQL